MKEVLMKLGISEEEIQEMIEMCPEIKDLEDSIIWEKVNLLKRIGCDEGQIADIISSNPFYLDAIDEDVIKLINKLKEYGFEMIEDLLEGNPYILNLAAFELEDYVNERMAGGELLKEVVEDLTSRPYLFFEM